nr:reverse transcriptase domain-containing protein [Tanacetum cinerariifolium]
MAGLTKGGGPEGQDNREVTQPPLTKELIEGHLSALTSIIKDHNRKNKTGPIQLDFDEDDTTKKDTSIAKGKEVVDGDLIKPFKEALKTPLTYRIIEFAANSDVCPIPIWCKKFQQTLDGPARGWFERLPANIIDEWVDLREAFTTRYSVSKSCFKEPHEITNIIRRANESLTDFKKDGHKALLGQGLKNSERDDEKPKEFFATKTQLRLAPPRSMINPQRGRTIDKLCDHHQEKGHHTNDCHHLRRQLEATLRSEDVSDEPLIVKAEVESEGLCKRTTMKFTIIKSPSLYIVILGRTGLRALRTIPSTIYSMMKFPTLRGIATLVTRSVIISECRRLEKKQVVEEEKKEEVETKVVNMTEKIPANLAFPDQLVVIGGGLPETCKAQLKLLLKDNIDIFSWEPADMMGFPWRIIEHKLNVDTSIEPDRQKRMVLAPEKSEVVTRDVGEWVKAGIVRPVRYPTWISNPVLVKNVTWFRECACPKEFYPLPNIDCKVESVMGSKYKCFLDAYKGYHQIQMSREDEDKTTLYIDQGTYCYINMPFGLKNIKGKQSPIQYVSRTLNEAKINYDPIEKLALSLVYMTRRLRRYFKAHPVKVITDQPIKQILNFITEMPKGEPPKKYFRTPKVTPERDETKEWMLFTDGESRSKGSGAGLVLIGTCDVEHTYALRLTFDSTNNEAEYEARLTRLRIAKRINIQKLEAKVDSKLVTNQINDKYIASYDNMMKYLAKAKEYIACFKSFSIKNIPGNENQKADVLSKLASVAFNHLTKEVLVEVLNERSIEVKVVNTIVEEEGDNWMTLIIQFLEKGIWPKDKNKARNLFGLPWIIVTDNGTQFVNDPFKSWCTRLNIQQMNTVVAHPQANELVKRANKSLMEGIKTRLEREKVGWVDELPNVLWAHRTSIKMSNGETSFILTYGSEAVIPAEIGMPTYKTMMIREGLNKEEIRLNLDLLTERKELATIREAKYKTKLEQYYNKKVHLTSFKLMEFMFQKNKASGWKIRGS